MWVCDNEPSVIVAGALLMTRVLVTLIGKAFESTMVATTVYVAGLVGA